MRCVLDHLTVTAPTLALGTAHVKRALGVAPLAGGTHPRMGTHNLLLRLGESKFLEVIAIDPAAPAPQRPRWFSLDDASATASPRLSAWVARTARLSDLPPPLLAQVGPGELMTRGEREWLITIRPDGTQGMGGALPSFIEWTTPRTPAATALPLSGCDLVSCTLSHPRASALIELLQSVGLDQEVAIIEGAPGLSACIMTPQGMRALSSHTDAD